MSYLDCDFYPASSPADEPDYSHVWELAQEAWDEFIEENPDSDEDEDKWIESWVEGYFA